jgi:hypothetical protein
MERLFTHTPRYVFAVAVTPYEGKIVEPALYEEVGGLAGYRGIVAHYDSARAQKLEFLLRNSGICAQNDRQMVRLAFQIPQQDFTRHAAKHDDIYTGSYEIGKILDGCRRATKEKPKRKRLVRRITADNGTLKRQQEIPARLDGRVDDNAYLHPFHSKISRFRYLIFSCLWQSTAKYLPQHI